MKFILRLILLLLVCATILPAAIFYLPLEIREKPELQDGDIIMQTSKNIDSFSTSFATQSLYTHVGVIDKRGDKILVLDSTGKVGRRPLDEWIAGGVNERYAVYRDKRMNAATAKAFLKAARPYMGAGYDVFYLFGNEEFYCSELPYVMYRSIGMNVGHVQTVGELWLLNPFTYDLIKKRWLNHPNCQALQMTFDQCYDILQDQRIITPSGLVDDENLTLIYSNYLGGLI